MNQLASLYDLLSISTLRCRLHISISPVFISLDNRYAASISAEKQMGVLQPQTRQCCVKMGLPG